MGSNEDMPDISHDRGASVGILCKMGNQAVGDICGPGCTRFKGEESLKRGNRTVCKDQILIGGAKRSFSLAISSLKASTVSE